MAKKEKTALQISVKALSDLLKLARSTKNDMAEMAGTFGSAIAKAVDDKHLHRKAFRSVVAEDRMEPEALRDFYDAQDYYRDALGLIERAKSAPRLPEGDDEEEAEDEGRGKKVTAFPRQHAAE